MKTLFITIGTAIILAGAAVYIHAAQQSQQMQKVAPRPAPAAFAPRPAEHPSAVQNPSRSQISPLTQATQQSAPTVSAPTASPMYAVTNVPLTIVFTVAILNPTPTTGSVNLLQIGPTGQPTILGSMHDDGLNADSLAGDGTYTLQTTVFSTSTGPLTFQVSAAFSGLLKRVLSPVLTLPVQIWPLFSDAASGMDFYYPQLTQTQRIVNTPLGSPNQLSAIDIEVFNLIEQAYENLVIMNIYSHVPGQTLLSWFAQNVDYNNLLISNDTFQQQHLQNGVVVMVQTGPVPAAYLSQAGPVETIYALSPDGSKIIVMSPGSAAQLSEFGFDTNTLLLQLLGSASFH